MKYTTYILFIISCKCLITHLIEPTFLSCYILLSFWISMWEWLGIYPEVWELGKNQVYCKSPFKFPLISHEISKVCPSQCFEFHSTNGSHWSPDLIQRLILFICVDTNKSWRLVLSIAFAVSWVNCGQLFSGLCISANH